MSDNVLLFDKPILRYRRLADECAKKEDFLGAIRFLTSAKNIDPFNLDVLIDLADNYADAGLLENANKCWFNYIDKAPKERLAVAYEELAINFFYLDNFWASSYYFHKKLEIDGFISKEGLSQEIIDFFSGEEHKKGSYKIAYPFDRADYSYEVKKAKHCMTIGIFDEGAKILQSIPSECLDEDGFGDLAVCLFMSDDLDGAEEVCRQSLKLHGDNVTAFCNLSTVYDMKEDFDNSDYYYRKALSCKKGDKAEAYKIATCAIEREDHQMLLECLTTILNERPYELNMLFFSGLCYANLGNFERAEQQLKTALSLDPEDSVVRFYYDYVNGLLVSGADEQNFMPFKYVKELPEQVISKYKKKIKSLVKNPEKMASMVKKTEVRKVLEWGLFSLDSQVVRDCVFVLTNTLTPYSKSVMMKALINPDGREELKRLIIYVLLQCGVKEKIGVVAGSFYCKLKPKKLACEKDLEHGGLYLSSYALCVSKMIFLDVEVLDKLAKQCDVIFKKLRSIITESDATNEEIAGLILFRAKAKKFSDIAMVTRVFSVDKNKLIYLNKLVDGEKND
ncbi:MAG: tetratricopeptide repeat protein [Clostridiales bacterium]|nr:tetratricopeptide repeat protein [Clostridiales bacterium]